MTVEGFDAAKDPDSLPPYNDIFGNFLQHSFLTMTDMKMMFLDRSLWKNEEGGKGMSPFDAHYIGYDLLSARILEYFDLLVAHSPWNVAKGSDATALGLNADIVSSLQGCKAEHATQDNINALEEICVAIWGDGKQQGVSSNSEDDINPPKHRCALFKEDGAGGNRQKAV